MSVVPLLDLLLTELSLYLHFLDIVDTIINLISTTNNFIFIIIIIIIIIILYKFNLHL